MFGGFFAGWPVTAQVTVSLALLSGLAWPVREFVQRLGRGPETLQSHDLHKLIAEQRISDAKTIDHLRSLLDRARRRESGWATGCELLLIAMPPQLTPEQVMILARARALFEGAIFLCGGEDIG